MGVKEAYIERVDSLLLEYDFEIAQLKIWVEKLGRGDSPEWLKEFHSFQDKEKKLHFHLAIFKRKNIILRNIAKIHIESLLTDLRETFHELANKYGYKPLSNDV